MIPGFFRIINSSVRYNKRAVIYQSLIIALLSAVITGSLLTGRSVRSSLKKSAAARIGNTGIVISSGIRYCDPSLADRVMNSAKISCTGILEMNGYSQNLSTQKEAFNSHIWFVSGDFFRFHGNNSININPGEVAVNKKLSDYLGLKTGDEIIIRFNEISDIPADAPFAPAKGSESTMVMKVGLVLEPGDPGNFSLSISQITPMNIFLNLSDLTGHKAKINRILIEENKEISSEEVFESLKNVLKLSDIGLNLRNVKKSGGIELISDRVFIDETIIGEIKNAIPSSAPVITYLGNRFNSGAASTPYSFISALPSSLYPEMVSGNNIIINRWMADDLSATEGDTLMIFWYSPDMLNKLIERSNRFIIKRIVDFNTILSDSLLMPDFPGISGSESCSDWDAGVPVRLDEIRRKDEDYWNKYKGTPKAFINYEKGKELWGNNFGPATAIRFPAGLTETEIEDKISGTLNPDRTGFTISDLSGDSVKAADESVDFSTLFLSLGFFLILSSIVLLSLAVSFYFDSKRGQVKIFFALGFNNRFIERILLLESGMIALIGCMSGSFAGYLVNIGITTALNSVWKGAVQTDTITAFFNLPSILSGLLISILATMTVMTFKIKRYLKQLNRKEKELIETLPAKRHLFYIFVSLFLAVFLFMLSFLDKGRETLFCFASGTLLLITLLLLWRLWFIGKKLRNDNRWDNSRNLSQIYYSFFPSHAVSPILFIAAGIFAVFITAANKMDFNDQLLKRSGGTGGYLLWCENSIPVREDLNSVAGKKVSGLDDVQLSDMKFVQAKKHSGNDASCLNLNHITSPPLLGIDPSCFISRGSFSFSESISGSDKDSLWQFLNRVSEKNIIYGIADQSVLQWGLKIKPGDTLTLRAENGRPLNIIMAGGLKSSVFQGNVVIGMDNFTRYFPSVSGSSVLLVDGDPARIEPYINSLNERLENHGIIVEKTSDRLASFYEVTNTYLTVFSVFGAFGLIIGIAGLGFVLLRNYNQRKKEFALMLATGFTIKRIRRMVLSEQLLILFAGVSSGIISALIATLPSIRKSPDIPWIYMLIMVSAIILTALTALLLSIRAVTNDSLTGSLRKD
jgi:ABC-type antimicrobial peptide transport system permease subunit